MRGSERDNASKPTELIVIFDLFSSFFFQLVSCFIFFKPFFTYVRSSRTICFCLQASPKNHTPGSESQHAVERLTQARHGAISPAQTSKSTNYVPIRARQRASRQGCREPTCTHCVVEHHLPRCVTRRSKTRTSRT